MRGRSPRRGACGRRNGSHAAGRYWDMLRRMFLGKYTDFFGEPVDAGRARNSGSAICTTKARRRTEVATLYDDEPVVTRRVRGLVSGPRPEKT